MNDDACAGPLTRMAVIGLPSGSESLVNTPGAATFSVPPSATVYASFTATGGSLQSGSVSPEGSEGAAGEQVCVCVGNVPTDEPLLGNVVPAVETVVQYVRLIVPCCAAGTPAALPTGRTSPVPPSQLTEPE